MKRVGRSLAIFFLGLVIGSITLLGLAVLPIPPEHILYALLGIRKPRIVGFLPYWLLSKTQQSYGSFLTNLTYFGLVVDTDGTLVKLASPTEEEPGWTALKGKPLNQLLSRAWWTGTSRSLVVHQSDEASISALLTDPQAHAKNLVDDVGPLMKKYGFRDLNLDIESFQEATPASQQLFTNFIQTVKQELVKRKLGTLTVDISVATLVKSFLADPVTIGSIADYVVLMAYDYHYLGSYLAGPVAPIGGAPDVREYEVETALKVAVRKIPKQKILLGIPLYGYQWETISERTGAPVIPRGGSTASNRRVEELLKMCAQCTKTIDPFSKEPVVRYPESAYFNQIYYEDQASLAEKIGLAQAYDIGGVALWALGYESDRMLDSLKAYKRSFQFLR